MSLLIQACEPPVLSLACQILVTFFAISFSGKEEGKSHLNWFLTFLPVYIAFLSSWKRLSDTATWLIHLPKEELKRKKYGYELSRNDLIGM